MKLVHAALSAAALAATSTAAPVASPAFPASQAFAQSAPSDGHVTRLAPTRVPTTSRHAGIYHVSSGTWTRRASATAAFGPDVIYSNTAPSGYFSSAGGNGGFAPGSTNIDEGGIPGTGNTDHPLANRDEYSVNGFEIGYCDLDTTPRSSGWEIGFYSKYDSCSRPDEAPDARINVGSLPSNGCWVLQVDLSGGAEFTLAADGGDGFQDDPWEDRFGWSFRYTGTGDGSRPAGFYLRGNPGVTDPGWTQGDEPRAGSNTYFGRPSPCGPGDATGYLTVDRWHSWHPSGVWTSCYWFGGYSTNRPCGERANPLASWHMEILADVGSGDELAGEPYCLSESNSANFVSTLFITGSADPADDNVHLRSQLPPNTFGFFLTSRTPGFVTLPVGSAGNLCLAGQIGRFVGPGQVKNSGPDGWISLDTNAGEWSALSIPEPTSNYAAATGITSHFQLWHRDSVNGTPTSNFSDAKAVTWE